MIILMLIHSIGYYFSKNKVHMVLSCGLFAFISNRETGAQQFSWDKFNHLGLDNDERGGDSIGRVVGDTVCKFISKRVKTTYQEYVINHKNDESSHIALGHTRKASVGEISEETAQPIVLKLPNNAGNFTMVHNGTIFNWEDLAKKYSIDKKSKSDSMVLAEIIMNNGFGVLLEYQGAAALIIKDDREPDTIKVFKGCSKEYYSKVSEERPLYFYQESKTSMYISSREEGLYFIGGDVDTVVDFDTNILHTIFAGEIIHKVSYDRLECSQNKIYTPVVVSDVRHGKNNFNTKYNFYDRYESLGYDSYNEERFPIERSSQVLSIKKDIIVNPQNSLQIICARLRYYFFTDNTTPSYANGPINLSVYGIKNNGTLKPGEKTYYFYKGIMMKDKFAYDSAKISLGKAKNFVDDSVGIVAVCEFTEYPVCTLDSEHPKYENACKYNPNTTGGSKTPYYYGTLTMLFGRKTYTFSSGGLSALKFNDFIKMPVHVLPPEVKVIPMTPVVPNVEKIVRNIPVKIDDLDFIHPSSCRCSDCSKFIRSIFKNNSLYEQDEFDDYATTDDIEVDYEDFSSFNDNEILEKTINEGLQTLLLSIDECRYCLEICGLHNKQVEIAMENFTKLENVLLETNKFKKYSLVTDYERF